jgi:hypothetical protein
VFVPAGRDALHRHQRASERIVLVSGSFGACLEPLAEDPAVARVVLPAITAGFATIEGRIAGVSVHRPNGNERLTGTATGWARTVRAGAVRPWIRGR